MDVDLDAGGKRFGWFLEAYEKKTEAGVHRLRVSMDTAAVSRMVGEDAVECYRVLPEWRREIEAHLDGAAALDWDVYDYFICSGQLHDSGDTDTHTGNDQRYPWFAPP